METCRFRRNWDHVIFIPCPTIPALSDLGNPSNYTSRGSSHALSFPHERVRSGRLCVPTNVRSVPYKVYLCDASDFEPVHGRRPPTLRARAYLLPTQDRGNLTAASYIGLRQIEIRIPLHAISRGTSFDRAIADANDFLFLLNCWSTS